MTSPRIVCFGELLWDVLPSGKVAGGAPFNIVNRANALGASATVISSVGQDDLGTALLDLVAELGNATSYIQTHPDLETSRSIITVSESGEPTYDLLHPVAWDDIQVNSEVVDLVGSCDAFIYSSLALRDERSREAMFEVLPHASLTICDINLRAGHYTQDTILRMLDQAHILRANEHELNTICKWLNITEKSWEKKVRSIYSHYNYQALVTTLGGAGAVCFDGTEFFSQPVFRVDVVDTVGAGDAFLAAFITSHLRDNPIQDSLRYGCAVGALTAAKAGGTPQISTAEIDAILTSANRHD